MRVAILLGFVAACLAAFLGLEKLIGFLIWMSGCVLVFAYPNFPLRATGWLSFYMLLSFLALLASLTAARTSISSALASDLVVGVFFTLFLFGVLQFELVAAYTYCLRD